MCHLCARENLGIGSIDSAVKTQLKRVQCKIPNLTRPEECTWTYTWAAGTADELAADDVLEFFSARGRKLLSVVKCTSTHNFATAWYLLLMSDGRSAGK